MGADDLPKPLLGTVRLQETANLENGGDVQGWRGLTAKKNGTTPFIRNSGIFRALGTSLPSVFPAPVNESECLPGENMKFLKARPPKMRYGAF
jgi:hypothetical protein